MQPKKPWPEPLATQLVMLFAFGTAVLAFFSFRDPTESKPSDWKEWLALVFGLLAIVVALFDRQMKRDAKRFGRSDALIFVIGPTPARLLIGCIGAAMFGSMLALVLPHR